MHNLPITCLFEEKIRHKRQVFFLFCIILIFRLFHAQLNKNKRENKIYLVKKANKLTREYQPTLLLPGGGAIKELDSPQVQGIIVEISKGGSDNYGVLNPQGAKGKANILSSPIYH